jgi:beta-lactamase regulating signal transducer with metallopeptidase domain
MDALLIDLGWKSALVAGAALILSAAMRRAAASERVMVLRAAVAALLMLPLFALAMPTLELAVLPAQDIPLGDAPLTGGTIAAGAPEEAGIDPSLLLYAAGAGLVLLHLVAGLLTLRRWTRTARPVADARWTGAVARAAAQLRRPVRLLVSPQVPGPLSWGIAPAWLLIGATTEQHPEQAEAVIAHEMAHVRRFDWPVLVASRIAMALFWFNPLVWLLVRTLGRQTELAADDDAIRHVAQADYAQTLLTVASPAVPSAACGMTVSQSMLSGRIRRVLESGAHRSASRLLGVTLLIATPAAALPLSALQFVPVEMPAPSPAPRAMPAQDAPAAGRAETLPAAATLPVRRAAQVRKKRQRVAPMAPVAVEATALPPAAPAHSDRKMRHAGPDGRLVDAETRKAIAAGVGSATRPPRPIVPARLLPEPPRPFTATYKRRSPPTEVDRRVALDLTNAARGLRTKAASFEKAAQNPALEPEARKDLLREVRLLRGEADRLDRNARRLIFEG